MKNSLFVRFISLFLFVSFAVTPGIQASTKVKTKPASKVTEKTVYQQIANEYILPSEVEEATPAKKDEEKPWYKKLFNQDIPKFSVVPLTPGQQKVVVFNTLLAGKPTNKIITSDGWADLQLFKHANLIEKIKRTKTTLGTAALAKLFVEPQNDITVLRSRQAVLTQLLHDPVLYRELSIAVKELQSAEAIFLDLWQEEDEVKQKFFKSISGLNFLFPKNSSVQEFGVRVTQIAQGFSTLTMAVMASWPVIYPLGMNYFMGNSRYPVPMINGANVYYSVVGIMALAQIVPLLKVIQIDCVKYLQFKLIHAAKAINAMCAMYETLKKNELFAKTFPGYEHMKELFESKGTLSKDLEKLIELLRTNTFKGEPSVFSRTGRILAAFEMMKEVKHEFKKGLETAGMVDAFVSMADLYKEQAMTNAPYCFVNFVDQDKPYFELQGFWNPLLNPASAIPNDMVLGSLVGESMQHPRNMILTGQNTAGKSTILQAMMLTALMAQTFGIAPARSVTMTPFSILDTHVNVTDDISNGRSLFANEVHRAKGLLNNVKCLVPGQFSFTIIDEMFRGTGPEHAEHLSYEYAKKLAQYPNAIVIESTHYKKLIGLEAETNGVYKNYKMEIHQNPDGSLTRPYKIENGYTVTNIAQQILKEQGLSLEDDVI